MDNINPTTTLTDDKSHDDETISVSSFVPWWVYILACHDNTLYTGISTDVERRVKEHNAGKKGAQYTKSRRPVHIVYKECPINRSDAQKREIFIKKLSRQEKNILIQKQPLENLGA